MARSSGQKANKATELLKEAVEKLDLIAIFRTFHLKNSEYTFFSRAHGTVSRTDHILGNKADLNTFNSIDITSSIFLDHNGLKLEINHRKRSGNKPITWRRNNMLLKNKCINWILRKSERKFKNSSR